MANAVHHPVYSAEARKGEARGSMPRGFLRARRHRVAQAHAVLGGTRPARSASTTAPCTTEPLLGHNAGGIDSGQDRTAEARPTDREESWFYAHHFPKNSQIRGRQGLAEAQWARPIYAEYKIYRWSPDDDDNPRVDTYYVDADDCGPMILARAHLDQ